ncbi:MAG: bifunctional adenosylcobinamide kinase/adenosylcobinamide-phosphate guanylyltransferase [Gammaproteobacteria bacterium]|nr:bifunctional adenosylcobinamide kinase/adenosylcobinamide-phosphate guanylyltransferase [Gammaproteobacteria bacterium]
MIHLVLGGARSGKSKYAEALAQELAEQTKQAVHYIATATIGDAEMRERIAHHQASRPTHWQLTESPFYLSAPIQAASNQIIIIDCLTLWLSNWLCNHDSEGFEEEKVAVVDKLLSFSGNCIIVSNEVGSGIVPMGALSRQFADHAGWLNQAIANVADKVTLVVAGCPLTLKEPSPR